MSTAKDFIAEIEIDGEKCSVTFSNFGDIKTSVFEKANTMAIEGDSAGSTFLLVKNAVSEEDYAVLGEAKWDDYQQVVADWQTYCKEMKEAEKREN